MDQEWAASGQKTGAERLTRIPRAAAQTNLFCVAPPSAASAPAPPNPAIPPPAMQTPTVVEPPEVTLPLEMEW